MMQARSVPWAALDAAVISNPLIRTQPSLNLSMREPAPGSIVPTALTGSLIRRPMPA
jgi:hypothetical protein